ncbi:MAG TPA: AI-2E family transporter [Candidatus Faecivivens stercoripullorum]|uniref:AI-2E family transporter n=1 Tax=Candidatus Faecivivens stercoripullorum TaxID=2840805 RepID=A0A9D1H662_9FIRM|nr:AI-2E family transporter [Candidatus Faecivivens stercoripullorum]
MNFDRQLFRKLLAVVAFGVLLNFAVQHLPVLAQGFSWVGAIIEPFLLGGVVAFILNVPLSAIERFLFPDKKTSVIETVIIKENELQDKAGEMLLSTLPGGRKAAKNQLPRERSLDVFRFRRPISLTVTLLLVAAVIAFVFGMVIPELGRTATSLLAALPGYFDSAQKWAMELLEGNQELTEYIAGLELDWATLSAQAVTMIEESGLIESIFGTASSLVGGVVSVVIGLVFSIYVLMRKEQLGRQIKMILYAFLPDEVCEQIIRIASVSSKTFSRFLSGQCTEAVILGTLFFIVMTLFGFPYALLCGVFIGFTALVPIFGSFLGCAVGAFLILMAAPERTIWFIIMFLVLQQIEGQLIYPHVVGNAVGLPSIWVLAAVSIGGSMFGIPGMLFFIPLSSVLYALLREVVYKRLGKKQLDPDEL